MASVENYPVKYIESGKEIQTTIAYLTPAKAIKLHCLDCSGGSMGERRNCHIKTCPLWPFRCGGVDESLKGTQEIEILPENAHREAV
jgi:hypothetical protein